MRMAIHLYEIAFEYEYNCKYCSAKLFLAKFAFNLYEFIGQDSYKIHELKKFPNHQRMWIHKKKEFQKDHYGTVGLFEKSQQ